MAKGKRSVALFEVIRQDKRFSRKEPAPAPLPRPQVVPVAPGFSAARIKELIRDKKAALGETQIQWKERFAKILLLWRAGVARISQWTLAAKSWAARQNSVAAGALVAMLVIGAVLLARRHNRPAAETASASRLIVDCPPHPSVLIAPPSSPQLQSNPAGLSPELAADVQQAGAVADPSLAQPGGRIVNMHYVLVQSYLDEKTADEAQQFLTANGIACTIERGVKGWRKDFYQVIGLEGFPRASGPAYLAYRRKIDELSVLFTQNHPHSYKHFEPEAIRW